MKLQLHVLVATLSYGRDLNNLRESYGQTFKSQNLKKRINTKDQLSKQIKASFQKLSLINLSPEQQDPS